MDEHITNAEFEVITLAERPSPRDIPPYTATILDFLFAGGFRKREQWMLRVLEVFYAPRKYSWRERRRDARWFIYGLAGLFVIAWLALQFEPAWAAIRWIRHL